MTASQPAIEVSRGAALARRVWTGEGVPLGRLLAYGALTCAVFGLLVVLVHGVVLDQDLVPAQIIAGSVQYPAGHPHAIFYVRVFNLPTYLMAALWKLMPNVDLLSALRNWAFTFLSAFVPFALTTVMTRRPKYGLIASAFVLSETIRTLSGVYPVFVYPTFNSDGAFGASAAVLIVALLLGHSWRWGGFFLGLLPAIHPTMAMIIWPWSLCFLFVKFPQMPSADRRKLFFCLGAGLAVCCALAVTILVKAPKTQPLPAYSSQANGEEIFQRFAATTDTHRQPLRVTTMGYSVHPLAFFALAGLLAFMPGAQFSEPSGSKLGLWLLVLGSMIWAYVFFGSMFFHSTTGWLSRVVQISMPGRFSVLSALLIVPMSVTLIASAGKSSLILTGLLFTQALLIPLHQQVSLIFVILGAAFAVGIYSWWQSATPRRRVISHLLLPGMVLGASGVLYLGRAQKGVIFLCMGLLFGMMALLLRRGKLPVWCESVALSVALLMCLKLPMNTAPASHMSAFDHQMNSWLKVHSSPDEMILAPMTSTELQVKTGHPILMEPETLYLMTYIPSLAPVIGTMARDLYGVDYADPSRLAGVLRGGRFVPGTKDVLSAWKSRTAAEWRSVAQKYNFRLVLAPTSLPLDINSVLAGPSWTLYSIE